MTAVDLTWGTDFDLRDDPPAEFVEQLRSAYPTEPEIDRTLTRKMRRRGRGPYVRPSLAELRTDLVAFLQHELHDEQFDVRDLHWFTGGVSKIQIGFTLDRPQAPAGPRCDHLVVRMDPAEGSNATSRGREYDLLRLMRGVVPVPEVFFLDADGEFFPEPALIYSFADGITKPRLATTGRVSGLGTNFGPELRAKLAPQWLEHLARIHTAPIPRDATFRHLQVPSVGTTESALQQVNHALRCWEEDRGEDNPLVDLAANYLRRHLPVLDVASVVHGDFRSGNFLFDEPTAEITAWLDWERGLIGDRHRDLAWVTMPGMGHYEDGRYFVCGLVPLDEFYDRYSETSGLPVDAETLSFYSILNSVSILVSTMASNYRIARLGRSHQDIVLVRVEGMEPGTARSLSALLTAVGA